MTKKATNKSRPKKLIQKSSKNVFVLVGTRKGAFLLKSDSKRQKWTVNGPHFLGCIIHHIVMDPRDQKTLLATVRTGHLGPTIYRSNDFGKTWTEAQKPPAFTKKADGKGRVVDHNFWLTPGHSSEKNVWYVGTSPQGIFRSEDGGNTWEGVSGFNDNPDLIKWIGGEQDFTPDGGKTHSILIDPRNPKQMYVGLSGGGFFESTDKGKSWSRMNKGCDRVFADPDPEAGHDPHCVRIHPMNPNIMYMQNHCGIYRVERPSETWIRIGKNMPKNIGDIGFPMTIHPRNPEMLWVFPMDGSTVWPRVSIDGKPAVYCSKNSGKSWQRQAAGLPTSQAWFTVKRQAMTADQEPQLGIYFGTTAGEVWMSRDEGKKWTCIARNLPHIYSIETGSK